MYNKKINIDLTIFWLPQTPGVASVMYTVGFTPGDRL